ncbi:MAG TPA: O-antigen ligase family protein [Xanthobacteraceae bacterium]|nr:O-antigen ligase family protein [Xanthobacteraceae bacterium]
MSILELYFFSHLVLRSFTNGFDRIFGLQSSLIASVAAIIAGIVVSIHFFQKVAIPPQIYKLILPLTFFILICFISYAVNAYAEDNIRDSFHAWYVVIQHFYLLAVIVMVACIYRGPNFVRYVYHACIIVIVIDSGTAIGQYLTGHTIMVTPYDKYARVAGLSAHPVTFSLEVAIIFFVWELARRKQRLSFKLRHAGICLLVIVALILSASRTGILLFGIVLGLYYLVRRPILAPVFLIAAAVIVTASPFETLFSELRSIPNYLSSGDFMTWDYHTAPTSVHWRIYHWYYMTSLGLSHPWFGFGPGQEISYSPFSREAHSQFVEIFFETGIIGLLAYCVFWWRMAKAALTPVDQKAPADAARGADLRALWFILFIGITLVSLFDQSFNLETVSFTFLIVSIFIMQAPPLAEAEVKQLPPRAAKIPAWRWRRASIAVPHAGARPGLVMLARTGQSETQ